MKEWIKPDRLHFKIGSLEWMNFFGLPIGLIGLGIISGYFYFSTSDPSKSDTFLFTFVPALTIGIITYIIQIRRLKFKSFELNQDLESFRRKTRLLLMEKKWRIEYDNQKYLIASSNEKFLSSNMLTLRFKKKEVNWNLIEHPYTHNSGAALLSFNLKGKKILKEIIASA